MSEQLERLLTTYVSQQEEMGIPVSLLQSRRSSDSLMQEEKVTEYIAETPVLSQPAVQEERPSMVQPLESKPSEATVTSSIDRRGQKSVREELAELYYQAKDCTACSLSQSRTKLVFGSGNANADLMIVGEAPGFDEDQEGLPFVGAAGQLLTNMLAAINLDRKEDTFICNVLKCRPPGNRTPNSEECVTCLPILKRQIAIIKPKIILVLGKTAAAALLGRVENIVKLRGEEMNYHGIPAFVSYEPSALLRNSALKRPAWEDLQLVQKRYKELISE